MKSIISTTYDDTYLFYLPITTWCWNKLDVEVVCFVPSRDLVSHKEILVYDTIKNKGLICQKVLFKCPEHKEATYAQCSRLYAAALDLPEDEILITSDVDMAVFKMPYNFVNGFMHVVGADLVPIGQYPMCYIAAAVKDWRNNMAINGRSCQQCLDDILGDEECENMRGNLWSRDQEIAHNMPGWGIGSKKAEYNRARPGTQFASNRYDRDDSFLLERLSPETIDYHMPRPGYEENNFNQILTVLKYHFPHESFEWLIKYRESYIELI